MDFLTGKFNLTPFTDEQSRIAVNLEAAYRARRDARRDILALGPNLTWRRRGDRQYLYTVDSAGGGSSLGPRSPETEAKIEGFRADRERLVDLERGAAAQLDVQSRLYRAARLLQVSSKAAEILRVLDELSMLGECLMAVGTNTMAAYELEAAARFIAGDDTSTRDFDLTWAGDAVQLTLAGGGTTEATLFSALKRVDDTYTVNTERPCQARNRDAYEVDLLVAPSMVGRLPRHEKLLPVALPEQEWLLRGRRIDQVVGTLDGSAARIVAPDPRWMALHKIWLSKKKDRPTLKKAKDERQGHMLLAATLDRMPHYPIDQAFRDELPDELSPLLDPAISIARSMLLAAATARAPAPRRPRI